MEITNVTLIGVYNHLINQSKSMQRKGKQKEYLELTSYRLEIRKYLISKGVMVDNKCLGKIR